MWNAAGRKPVWPLHRPPMLQQAFAQHVVSLNLGYHIDTQELVSICDLTRLTHLRLYIPRAEDGGSIFSSLTALQQLCSLHLSGQKWETAFKTTVAGVDWTPLTRLTHLSLIRWKASLILQAHSQTCENSMQPAHIIGPASLLWIECAPWCTSALCVSTAWMSGQKSLTWRSIWSAYRALPS